MIRFCSVVPWRTRDLKSGKGRVMLQRYERVSGQNSRRRGAEDARGCCQCSGRRHRGSFQLMRLRPCCSWFLAWTRSDALQRQHRARFICVVAGPAVALRLAGWLCRCCARELPATCHCRCKRSSSRGTCRCTPTRCTAWGPAQAQHARAHRAGIANQQKQRGIERPLRWQHGIRSSVGLSTWAAGRRRAARCPSRHWRPRPPWP